MRRWQHLKPNKSYLLGYIEPQGIDVNEKLINQTLRLRKLFVRLSVQNLHHMLSVEIFFQTND
jgi:hypothetical protein